jgi:hypothetical protein
MSLKIALIMMQKNESLLLEPWIRYHVDLIGTSSIFIYDNGSTDTKTLTTLADAENIGIKINRTYSHQKDYYARGEIFADLIKSLDASNPHDFYFPIDCDEFLACDIDGKLSCQRDDILASLAPLIRDGEVLTIPHKYVNSPFHINRYSKITNCKKCFFAQGACEALSDGFHEGKSKDGNQERQTKITYIEFHYKPYADHMRLSAQKIDYLIPRLTRKNLAAYAKSKRSNYHAAHALLESEYSYRKYFANQPSTTFNSCLLDRFKELSINAGPFFSDQSTNTCKAQIAIRAKHLAMKAQDKAEEVLDHLRSIAGFVKRRLLRF